MESHLRGVQPVLELLSAADVRQGELVETVFACQRQQGSAHADAQQHKEPRKVTDAHLKGLTETGRRQIVRQIFTVF